MSLTDFEIANLDRSSDKELEVAKVKILADISKHLQSIAGNVNVLYSAIKDVQSAVQQKR